MLAPVPITDRAFRLEHPVSPWLPAFLRPRPSPPLHPDYRGGSLLNLMATLTEGLGLPSRGYQPLAADKGLTAAELAASGQIVLLVVDGLGDEILARIGPDTLLAGHRRAGLTSVFPSTTASAVPTLLTGLPPAAHGLTGWHMWFEEIGETLAVLPLLPRRPPPPDWNPDALPPRLFSALPLARQLAGRNWMVSPRNICDSPCNRYHGDGAIRVSYQGTADFFSAIEDAVAAARRNPGAAGPAYIHAYYPVLDGLMHEYGTGDPRVGQRLQRFDAAFAACLDRLAGSDTLFVVTADHGFIDAPRRHLIELDAHPQLAALLARPLCGERRVAYAYVAPANQEAFATYVRRHLAHACHLFSGAEFIAAGWFGPGPAHPRLASRVGDFVLLMRGDWTIKDWLPGEQRYDQPGVHAGASAAEMRVPLIVVRP